MSLASVIHQALSCILFVLVRVIWTILGIRQIELWVESFVYHSSTLVSSNEREKDLKRKSLLLLTKEAKTILSLLCEGCFAFPIFLSA